MKKLPVALAALAVASRALASGDSGTSGVGEMSISGAQFAMMVGALAGLGVVVWLVAKVAMGGKKK
jgi:hypothetical protein